jgi:hypothetical protein
MLSILVLLAVPMLYLTVKVKRLVWKRDKILPLMLMSLSGSVLAFICYYVFELVSEYHLEWQNGDSYSYACCVSYFPNLPAFLLSQGILLNLNKWIQYLLKILSFVKVQNNLNQQLDPNDDSRLSSRMSGT